DPALVELAVDGVRLEQSELVRLEHLRELRVPNRPGLFSSLEQLLKLLVRPERVQLDCRHTRPPMVPQEASIETRSARLLGHCTRIDVMSSRNLDIRTGASPGLDEKVEGAGEACSQTVSSEGCQPIRFEEAHQEADGKICSDGGAERADQCGAPNTVSLRTEELRELQGRCCADDRSRQQEGESGSILVGEPNQEAAA